MASDSNPDEPVSVPRALGRLGGALFRVGSTLFLVVLGLHFLSEYLDGAALTPETATPEAAWVPVVNPARTPGGDPVAGVYRVTFPDGTTCYAYRGLLVDQFSCVE